MSAKRDDKAIELPELEEERKTTVEYISVDTFVRAINVLLAYVKRVSGEHTEEKLRHDIFGE